MRTAIVTRFLAVSFSLAAAFANAGEAEVKIGTTPNQGQVIATGLKSKAPSRATDVAGQPMPLINDPKVGQDLLSAYQIQLKASLPFQYGHFLRSP